MPGTFNRDANAPELINATQTISTTGSWVRVPQPGNVSFHLDTGTITGTNPTCIIEVQGADDSSGTGIVSYGQFPSLDGSDDDTEAYLDAYVSKSYVRATTTLAGTTPSFELDLHVRLPHDRRVRGGRTADADVTA